MALGSTLLGSSEASTDMTPRSPQIAAAEEAASTGVERAPGAKTVRSRAVVNFILTVVRRFVCCIGCFAIVLQGKAVVCCLMSEREMGMKVMVMR
jgi:hypothetical protein